MPESPPMRSTSRSSATSWPRSTEVDLIGGNRPPGAEFRSDAAGAASQRVSRVFFRPFVCATRALCNRTMS